MVNVSWFVFLKMNPEDGKSMFLRNDADIPWIHIGEKTLAAARASKPKKNRTETRKVYIARTIDHPLFKNCSHAEASAELADGDVGDFIIRSSSKGVKNLSRHHKMFDDVYWQYISEKANQELVVRRT